MRGAAEVRVAGEGEGSEEVEVDMRGAEGMVRGKVEVNGKWREENTR